MVMEMLQKNSNKQLFIMLAITVCIVACHTSDADETSVRVKREQVLGPYVLEISDDCLERLELKPDGTFVQEFNLKSQSFRNQGHWRLENEFMHGSLVVLDNAVLPDLRVVGNIMVAECDPQSIGSINLYTHERQGKITLAQNEIMDWYYNRVQ